MSDSPELPVPTANDAEPARVLVIELDTRIATQALHYRAGDEETAVTSLYDLFKLTRALMVKHWEALAFATAGNYFLNELLRPNTARWHRWIVDKKFADERSRRQFRYELQLLQPRLAAFRKLLHLIAEEKVPEARQAFADFTGKSRPGKNADLGRAIEAGIAREVPLKDGKLHPDVADEHFATAEDIDRAEHAAILERRKMIEREDPPPNADPAKPDLTTAPLKNATGLCLSGGGIRSATFCLGIAQVLAKQKLLKHFDYLSTVSGGGYFGSFLTAFLGTPAEDSADAASSPPKGIRDTIAAAFTAEGGRESAAVRHLRNNSRYLLSGGLWGHLKRAGLIISGIATNILLMLPLPLIAAVAVWRLAACGYWRLSPRDNTLADTFPALLQTLAFDVFSIVGIVLAVAWLLLPLIRNFARGEPPDSNPVKLRIRWEATCVVLGVFVVVTGLLLFVPATFHVIAAFHAMDWAKADFTLFGHPITSEKLVAAVTALAPIILGLFAANSKSGTRRKRWTTLLFTLSGPLLALTVFLVVGRRLVRVEDPWSIIWVLGITLALIGWGWLLVDLNEFSPHRYYRNRLCECYLAVRRRSQRGGFGALRKLVHGRKKDETFTAWGVGALHHLPLSCMNKTRAAPYHLINTAVNLPASLEPNLRGRDCDFYTFSRDYVGGPVCGYFKTSTLEKLDPHVDLGTAMAVSGAAASSNMGVNTMRHLRFLLTLLNIRLGYWLRNPSKSPRNPVNAPGPQYLFREMTGWMHEKTGYLNLSDGGHIENLALYEMLRRRCKFIVVVDGGQEPGMEFADFMLAQRYAEIDLGVRFDIDLADLALNVDRRSRAYAVFGKVHYPPRGKQNDEQAAKAPEVQSANADDKKAEQKQPHDLGWIIYFKLARTGSEPGYVADYARQNPDFPHQTTGDQMYDEAQFEAYRRLGECAAESLFRPEIANPYLADRPEDSAAEGEPSFRTLDEWFQALANSLLPDNDEVFDRRSEGGDAQSSSAS